MVQPHHQHRHRLLLRRKLTARRWPEKELVSVPALETYYTPPKPLDAPANDGTATVAPTVTIENPNATGRRRTHPTNKARAAEATPAR